MCFFYPMWLTAIYDVKKYMASKKPDAFDLDDLLGIKLNYYKKMDTSNNTNFPAKTIGLDFTEAMKAITEGFKVRIPEWTGYWFRNGKDISVLTRTGDIINTPNFNNYVMRDDWQIVTEGLGFDFAMLALKAGKSVRVSTWPSDIYLTLQVPDVNSKMTVPYIYGTSKQHGVMPWLPDHIDLFSKDWEVFDPTSQKPVLDTILVNQKVTDIQSSPLSEHPGLDQADGKNV